MTVTKTDLEALRAAKPVKNNELHYTIGGTIETQVHSSVEAERIGKLNRGDRTMQVALLKMRHDRTFSAREGYAKAQFNQTTLNP